MYTTLRAYLNLYSFLVSSTTYSMKLWGFLLSYRALSSNICSYMNISFVLTPSHYPHPSLPLLLPFPPHLLSPKLFPFLLSPHQSTPPHSCRPSLPATTNPHRSSTSLQNDCQFPLPHFLSSFSVFLSTSALPQFLTFLVLALNV